MRKVEDSESSGAESIGSAVVSFSASPAKSTYSPGERIVLIASIDGDRPLLDIMCKHLEIFFNWWFNNQFPSTSDDTYTYTVYAGTAGSTLTVTAGTNSIQVNGVERISIKGQTVFTFKHNSFIVNFILFGPLQLHGPFYLFLLGA